MKVAVIYEQTPGVWCVHEKGASPDADDMCEGFDRGEAVKTLRTLLRERGGPEQYTHYVGHAGRVVSLVRRAR